MYCQLLNLTTQQKLENTPPTRAWIGFVMTYRNIIVTPSQAIARNAWESSRYGEYIQRRCVLYLRKDLTVCVTITCFSCTGYIIINITKPNQSIAHAGRKISPVFRMLIAYAILTDKNDQYDTEAIYIYVLQYYR